MMKIFKVPNYYFVQISRLSIDDLFFSIIEFEVYKLLRKFKMQLNDIKTVNFLIIVFHARYQDNNKNA